MKLLLTEEQQRREQEEERRKELQNQAEAHAEAVRQQQGKEPEESIAQPAPDARKVGDGMIH